MPVHKNDVTVAYLFHGSEQDPDSAGLISAVEGDFQPVGSGYWYRLLRVLYAKGLSAAEAVQSLLGAEGPEPAGRIGLELQRYENKRELDYIVNPSAADRRRSGMGADDERRIPNMSRAEIDEALLARGPIPERIAERIRTLDEILSMKPTPEPLMVSLVPSSARIPDHLAPGVRMVEPTFLTAFLAGLDSHIARQSIVVKLRVPAGTPALLLNPAAPSEAGMLLLGRGIQWEVDRVEASPTGTLVTAHIVSRAPRPLS